MIDSALDTQTLNYEQRLNQDSRWAMSEGGRHFDETSEVHTTLERICHRLNELNIPYAVAGGMALFQHGFRRFTEDVDILVTPQDLKRIHENLSGRGYLPLFERSKNLRDTVSGVRIEFLLTGGYPGDGKAKPVAFPAPDTVAEFRNGIKFLSLSAIVELKLASGMTGADRMKDLADVQELIKLLSLPRDFGSRLNPYVQAKFLELWQASRGIDLRYIRVWRINSPAARVQSIEDLIANLPDAADMLGKMQADGVTLDLQRGPSDDYVRLVTTDPNIARKYDMHDESEFWDEDDSGSDTEQR